MRVQIKQNKRPLNHRLVFVLVIALIFFGLSSILLLYPFASRVKEDYFAGNHPIIFDGVQAGNGIVEGETVYLPLSFLQDHIDENIWFDEKSNSVIITTGKKVVQMPSESLTYFVNEEPVKLHFSSFISLEDDKYLAAEPLLNYYPIDYSILPDTGAIWVKKEGDKITAGKVTSENIHEEKLRLRKEPTLRSPYTGQTAPKETIYIEGEKDDYLYVRKEDGTAGYLHKKFVQKGKTQTIATGHQTEEISVPNIDGPIHLTWEAVYTKNPDTDKIPSMPGVNVVSPTWFELANEQGDIKNLGSLSYVKWAKGQGYQVWGLFSNAFDPDLTYQAFKDFDTRQKMIRELLHYAKIYQLDGINIDIENVNPEHGPIVTQFVRELAPYFHEAGLIVSMDITFIAKGNWSEFYEREKLAKVVDYLIVMAYDEHWGNSPVAGSVASLPWVENNLQKLLEIVPNDKLVLGVPLYTRLWEEKDSGEMTSKALSMADAKQWIEKNNLSPIYDEKTGQNYAELRLEEEQTTYKIWLEDEISLKKRAEIATKYNLAGVASWARYFADETAWTALSIHSQTASAE